jgi:hypothetical protein
MDAASFNPGSLVLSVFGDNLNNSIVASRNAARRILVNGDRWRHGDGCASAGGNQNLSRNILSYLLSPLRRYRQETLRGR